MIEFWLAVGLLLLVGTAFLLVPVLRGRRAQAEEDRTALNVALYQERLAELTAQREAGTLTVEQFDAGQAEAARELLADTEGAGPGRGLRLGKALPLLLALALPVLAFGLYWHWGASQQLAAMQEQPSMQQMAARLEQAVKDNPDSAEAWYFLGRLYMGEGRAAEAAKAFEQVIRVAGREPELLGQWAQALYFSGSKQWSAQLQALTDEALRQDPNLHFAIIGGSPAQVDKYQTALMDAGLADRVFFPGHIHPDELPHVLAAADILLSPRIAGNNTPLKLLDYLKAGRPIVACDNPANRLILGDENARLVAPAPDAFADGIAALAADAPLRQRLGDAGHQLHLSTYNYRQYRQRLADAYRQLLGPAADVTRDPRQLC